MPNLVDVFTRYQIYLEGYKVGLEPILDPILYDMQQDIELELARTRVENLNALTRKQLLQLVRNINKIQKRRYSKVRDNLLKELEQFTVADAQLHRQIMETIEGRTIEDAFKYKVGLPLFGLLPFLRGLTNRNRLWAIIQNSIDPASGDTPKGIIEKYLTYVTKNVSSIVNRGYANGWSTKETIANIFGTKAKNFKDGFIRQAYNKGRAAVHTLVQHISSTVQAGVNSIFYRLYKWVSIIDDATTGICRSRNNNVYEYGKGPIPPAHYFCRSRVVPVKEFSTELNVPSSFFTWYNMQPDYVKNNIIKRGKMSDEDLARFSTGDRLTLDEFVSKFVFIVFR